MKKFLIKSLFFIVPLILVPTINYTIDISHVYHYKSYAQQLVNILRTSPYVTNIDANQNDRYFKKLLLEQYHDSVDIIILGSSRVITFSNSVLIGNKVLNLGVTSGLYEDMCALMFDCVQNNIRSKKVLIGFDPHFLNPNIEQESSQWKTLFLDYAKYHRKVIGTPLWSINFDIKKWANLFSVSYFQENIFHGQQLREKPQSSNVLPTDLLAWAYDGSRTMSLQFESSSKPSTTFYENPLWSNFLCIDTYQINRWYSFISYLSSLGFDVYILKMPYHPNTYWHFMHDKKFHMMCEAIERIDLIFAGKNVKMIGSYNPAEYGLDEQDFYDNVHLKYSGVKKCGKIILDALSIHTN